MIQIDEQAVAHLPALAIAQQVNEQLRTHNRLIITAAPGAGKSTLLPLTLLQGLDGGGKILMLEPRRLAAKQIAERMAALLHEEVGQTVGYRVRFEKKVGKDTRIEVLTEGILTRMLVNDPMLEGVSMVVFDEFHERSLTLDVALALTREAQQVIRPDLRIIVMSATIDTTSLSRELNAPVVESEGRMFPVTINHATEDCTAQNVAEQVAIAIKKAHSQEGGDILAFLPGQAEILRCQELLGGSLGSDTTVHPLYGMLSAQEQRSAILPSPPGRRKVVLATSIAETSLTIEGVRVVVDSGLARTMVFDQRNGLSHLATVRISNDMATQRSGRAGRVAPGICFRLWTLATSHRMEENRLPEILTADLAPMVLDAAAWGESDAARLPWLTPPPAGNLAQANRLLQLLGATSAGKITPLGKKMAEMLCHPRIARMLVLEDDAKKKALAADIAALIEEKDPLADATCDADINTRISLLRTARARHNEGRWSRIARIAKEYRRMARVEEDNESPLPEETGALIASAYPERVAMATDGCGRFRLAGGDSANVQNSDALSSCNWMAIASLNAASGKIFLASPLNPDSIFHLAAEKENISWDAKQGRLVAQQERKIGNLLLSSHPVKDLDRDLAIATICQATPKEGLSMFDFNDDVLSLQRRVACVALWHPELGLPDLSTEAVLNRSSEWLPFFLERNGSLLTTAVELKKIDLKQALWTLLTYDQQLEVDRLAPTHITVPTGSRIRVDYRQGAEVPVLSVRLQECFGLTDTPCVNDGRLPVLMELLSPGFKPVQLTADLRSFWNGTYFEVRKELRRRYPKHSWPENPLEAEAVRGVKKK